MCVCVCVAAYGSTRAVLLGGDFGLGNLGHSFGSPVISGRYTGGGAFGSPGANLVGMGGTFTSGFGGGAFTASGSTYSSGGGNTGGGPSLGGCLNKGTGGSVLDCVAKAFTSGDDSKHFAGFGDHSILYDTFWLLSCAFGFE